MTYPTYVLSWSLSPLLQCGVDTACGAWLNNTIWPHMAVTVLPGRSGACLVWLQWHMFVALTL